jgi:hypothetical protein
MKFLMALLGLTLVSTVSYAQFYQPTYSQDGRVQSGVTFNDLLKRTDIKSLYVTNNSGFYGAGAADVVLSLGLKACEAKSLLAIKKLQSEIQQAGISIVSFSSYDNQSGRLDSRALSYGVGLSYYETEFMPQNIPGDAHKYKVSKMTPINPESVTAESLQSKKDFQTVYTGRIHITNWADQKPFIEVIKTTAQGDFAKKDYEFHSDNPKWSVDDMKKLAEHEVEKLKLNDGETVFMDDCKSDDCYIGKRIPLIKSAQRVLNVGIVMDSQGKCLPEFPEQDIRQSLASIRNYKTQLDKEPTLPKKFER